MATLTDLANKRGEMETAIADYKQALADYAASTITLAQKDAALATAQAKGDEYAKLAGQVKKDNPSLTSDQFYSNGALMSELVRSDVATIMTRGTLSLIEGLYDDFSLGSLDAAKWSRVIEGNGQLSWHDDETATGGKHLRIESFGNYFTGLISTQKLPPGGIYKARVRPQWNSRYCVLCAYGVNPTDVAMHTRTGAEYGLSLYTQETNSTMVSFRRESGSTAYQIVSSPKILQGWNEVEIHRESATSHRVYLNGTQIYATSGSGVRMDDDYGIWLGVRDQIGGAYLDVDYAVMIPPAV